MSIIGHGSGDNNTYPLLTLVQVKIDCVNCDPWLGENCLCRIKVFVSVSRLCT